MKQSNLWPKLFPLNDRAYFVHTIDDYMSMLQMYRRDIELSTNTSSVISTRSPGPIPCSAPAPMHMAGQQRSRLIKYSNLGC